MKKFFGILGAFLFLGTNAGADVCYDVNDTVASNAVNIIKAQKEIYKYCSICPDANPKTISVDKVQNSNPVYVNGIALDLAHTYFKKDNKFVNLGVASGCIKAGEYDIPEELENLNAQINKKNKIKILQQEVNECSDKFKATEKNVLNYGVCNAMIILCKLIKMLNRVTKK